jgi:glycosyltransferase involved in cell wall biosynthesis
LSANQFRVGFDISALDPNFKEHAQRGIGRYVRELKAYFAKFSEVSTSSEVNIGFFDHADFGAGKIIDGLIKCSPLGRETLRQQIVYPLNLRKGSKLGFDLLHFPAQMDAPSWSPMPYMVTVLDLIPIVCRDLYQSGVGGWRFRLARWLELRSIQSASRVLVISENTGNDVHKILGVPWERISVTPLGVNRSFFEAINPDRVSSLKARYKIPGDRETLLYVGGIDQRKNWDYMFQVLAKLRKRASEQQKPIPYLVIAGRIDQDRQYPSFIQAIKKYDLQDIVLEIGYVPDPDLATLYHSCSLFFFPSLYEGFGLPPLEALATGMKVVSSNTSSMPEILGDCAAYIDPKNVEQGADVCYEMLFNRTQTPELIVNSRKQAQQFTWEKTGEKTIAAYLECARSLNFNLSKTDTLIKQVHA